MSSTGETITLRTRVPADAAGRTLLGFLCGRFRYHGEAGWLERIADGRVTVDGASVRADHVLRRGAVVAYVRPAAEPDVPTDIVVVHDRDGVLVVDKPARLPFHADGAFLTRTVVGVLAAQVGAKPRPVQRLDRETSGLCVLARDRATARALNEEVARGGFAKEYLALVTGEVRDEELLIDAPIGRDPDSEVSIRRAVVPVGAIGAETAVTAVAVVARGRGATLVRCTPRTGRTHQIRVHLTAAGHPLVGDKLYGRTDAEFLGWVAHVKRHGTDDGTERFGAPRQMLHSSRLSCTDPLSGERLTFATDPPADFVAAATNFELMIPPSG